MKTQTLIPVKTGYKDEVVYVNPNYVTSIKSVSMAHYPPAKWEMWVVGQSGYGTFSVILTELPEELINRKPSLKEKIDG